MIKLIIFDLDGVLADTEEMHYSSLVKAVEDTLAIPKSKFAHLIPQNGKTTKYKLSILQKSLNLTDEQIVIIDDTKQQNVLRYFYRNIPSSPDQATMLRFMKERYTLAVASNSRKENVLRVLNILGITNYFSMILSNDDVTNPKPDPEIFRKIMDKENVSPNETIILEDSEAGRAAVRAAEAHLFPVENLNDVTLERIQHAIRQINSNDSSANGGNGLEIRESGL